jgi:replicative superfamily II helicase
VDLLLIDEVHHLGEERGAVLEIVVVRMRLLSDTYHEKTSMMVQQPTQQQRKDEVITIESSQQPNTALHHDSTDVAK